MPKKHYDENLFEKIIDDKNLYYAYLKSRNVKGKYKIEAIKFAMDETYNLRDTWNLYFEEYPTDITRGKDSTFTVDISANGEIKISPDEPHRN